MKLDYCSPSEEQKYKKQLGDCPEAPASFPASWEDRRWTQDEDELPAAQMLPPRYRLSLSRAVPWHCQCLIQLNLLLQRKGIRWSWFQRRHFFFFFLKIRRELFRQSISLSVLENSSQQPAIGRSHMLQITWAPWSWIRTGVWEMAFR